MRSINRVVAALALMTAAAGCGGSGTGSYGNAPTAPPPTSPPSTSNTITIGDDYFRPQSTTVARGTTVTWNWTTGTTHNVTFGDGTSSGDKSSGSYSRTFNSAGTFNYECTIHYALGMTGTIVVQ